MLSSTVSWILGGLLLLAGVLASLYLVWIQIRHGLTGFSLLATSDALATIAIAIAFIMNASRTDNALQRTSVVPTECNQGHLVLASALFLAPFINAFISMMAHSAEISRNSEPGTSRGWRSGAKPKLASSMVAQWVLPTISALILLTANIHPSRPFRSNTETCLDGMAMVPMSVETMEQCLLHQEDISEYITFLMNNPNYSSTHNMEVINTHRQEVLKNTDKINNQTTFIVDKIYKLLQGSSNYSNRSKQKRDFNSVPSSIGTIKNVKSKRESDEDIRQSGAGNSGSRPSENDENYYSTSDEDYVNKDESPPLSNQDYYDVEETSTDSAINHDQETSTPPADDLESHIIEQSDSTSNADKLTSSADVQSSPVVLDTITTTEMLSTNTETTENIIPLSKQDSDSFIQPASTSDPLTTQTLTTQEEQISFQFTTAQTKTTISTELQTTDTQTTAAAVTTKEDSTIPAQIDADDPNHVQIPDTVNMCVVKCYFSESFLKKYLFVLLFLFYFIPILVSVIMYITTGKVLSSTDIKPTTTITDVKPSTTTEMESANDIPVTCNMHLAKMTSASKMVKQSIASSILLWTPAFLETLLRVWFCIGTPEWLTVLLFVLGQVHTVIRNVFNLQLVRGQTCSGAVQPIEAEQNDPNLDIPTKLFTKVKAAILK